MRQRINFVLAFVCVAILSDYAPLYLRFSSYILLPILTTTNFLAVAAVNDASAGNNRV